MIWGRMLGRLFCGLAFLAAGAEIVRSLTAAAWEPLALGEIWFALHRDSLGLAQAGIQRYVHETLWDPVVVTLLLGPVWAYAMLLGAILLWLFRVRPGRRIFSR